MYCICSYSNRNIVNIIILYPDAVTSKDLQSLDVTTARNCIVYTINFHPKFLEPCWTLGSQIAEMLFPSYSTNDSKRTIVGA